MRRAPVRGALAACALIPLSAWAVDQDQEQNPTQPGQQPAQKTELSVTAGLGETDNVGLTETGRQSQTIASVGTLFDIERQGQLEGVLKGGVDYLYFVEHAFPGQVVGRADGDGSYALVPDHVKWVLQDNYGTAQVDALVPEDRNNIQSVNVASTGPDFQIRPSENSFVRLGGRYALVNYETSPFNSHRTLGMFSIGDELSLASIISLNADVTQVHFQNTTFNPDYDRRKFYVSYNVRGARTNLTLDLGTAQVDDTGPWNSKLLAQAVLSRDLTPRQSVVLSGGRQFTDSADSFRSLTSGAAGTNIVAPAAGTAGNYLADSGSVGWRFKEARTSLDVSGRWERDRYTIQPTPFQIEQYLFTGAPVGLDATRTGAEARLRRDITPVVTADVRAAYSHENLETLGFADHSWLVGVGATFNPARRLSYRLRFDHSTRNVDEVPGALAGGALAASVARRAGRPGTGLQGVAQGFREDQIFFTAVYRLSE